MVVIVLQKVTAALRGELTRWLFEVKSGVYIGHVSALVRDKLWQKCTESKGAGSVFQAWTTNTEQHFSMRLAGDANRCVVDWEGVQLVQELECDLSAVQKRRIRTQ